MGADQPTDNVECRMQADDDAPEVSLLQNVDGVAEQSVLAEDAVAGGSPMRTGVAAAQWQSPESTDSSMDVDPCVLPASADSLTAGGAVNHRCRTVARCQER